MERRIAGAVAALLLAAAASSAAGGPRRIVCLGPSVVETVFALGCGDRVVGVDDYAAWPEAVRSLPRLGGLADPALERIAALGPDLVLLAAPIPPVQELARRQGIDAEVVPMEGIGGILAGIAAIARRLGCPGRGEALVRDIRKALAAVRRSAPERGPVVVLQIGRPAGPGLAGLVVAGGGSYLSELAALAGARNPFAGARRPYLTPPLERLAASPPERVLVFDAGAPDPEREAAELAAAWAAVTGPPPPRVTVLADPVFVVPGPRVAEAARRLAAILAPEGSGP